MTTPDVPSTGSGVESSASPSTASPADGAEDPRRRAVRLRHRRRLLAWGAVPALLASVISIWLGFVFLMTLAANRSVIAQDYPAAVSRYETVARVNPWLDKWRVHYNLGTARLLADDTDGAVDELEEALTSAPSSSSSPSPASASPSPADPQRDKLQDRNDRANGTGNKGGNGRKW